MTNAIQLINIARSQLGLQEEDTWRAKLLNIVGESSLRKMTEHQLAHVLTVLKNEGFEPKKSTSKRSPAHTLSGRFAAPIRAFWLSGYNLGVIDRKDDRAILAFARRQVAEEHVRFVTTPEGARAIIEAIKTIVRRDADLPDLWRPVSKVNDWRNDGRVQVLFAQWDLLKRMGVVLPDAKLIDWRPGCDLALTMLAGPVLIEMQQALGSMIRENKKKAAA